MGARPGEGGDDGAPGRVGLTGGGALAAKGLQYVVGTDRVRLELPGGAGYGPPAERSADLIADDVENELVSPERAKSDYDV